MGGKNTSCDYCGGNEYTPDNPLLEIVTPHTEDPEHIGRVVVGHAACVSGPPHHDTAISLYNLLPLLHLKAQFTEAIDIGPDDLARRIGYALAQNPTPSEVAGLAILAEQAENARFYGEDVALWVS